MVRSISAKTSSEYLIEVGESNHLYKKIVANDTTSTLEFES